MKKVIITGANGFIGSWLCEEYSKNGHKVTAVVKDEKSNVSNISNLSNVQIVYCKLEDINSLPEKINNEKHDLFVHLAWIDAGGPGRANYSTQLLNVKYSCDCIYIAHALGCTKIMAAGTITEKVAENIEESELLGENLIYGVAKNTSHYIMKILCMKLDIQLIWMRLANVYGPRSVNGNIVGYTLTELINKRTPTFSNAQQYYDLIFIEDLIKAIYLLGTTTLEKNSYYIGSGRPRRLREYLILISNIYDVKSSILFGVRPDDGIEYEYEWFNTEDLKMDTGYCCNVKFEDGIHRTIKWLEENTEDVI